MDGGDDVPNGQNIQAVAIYWRIPSLADGSTWKKEGEEVNDTPHAEKDHPDDGCSSDGRLYGEDALVLQQDGNFGKGDSRRVE
jgi:hypothetical protein